MRKAERLFQLLTLLRSRRRVITAQVMAECLEVSERTIYRDIQALSLSGVPIEGEAGVGYRLKPGYSLPPIMFNEEELEALLLGARMVRRWGDSELGKAATTALDKIRATLPDQAHHAHLRSSEWMLVPDYSQGENARFGDLIRTGVREHRILHIDYRRADGEPSQRRLWPLGMVYWGTVWTLVGWCELRGDYRQFRLDRIVQLQLLEENYPQRDDISLQKYLASVCDVSQDPPVDISA